MNSLIKRCQEHETIYSQLSVVPHFGVHLHLNLKRKKIFSGSSWLVRCIDHVTLRDTISELLCNGSCMYGHAAHT